MQAAITKANFSNPPPGRGLPGSWWGVALVSALFGLAVGVAMLISHHHSRTADPWQSPALLALKTNLLSAPKDEPLKQQIRTLDLELRGRYFRQMALNRSGAWLLLVASGVFVYASAQVMRSRQRLPMPQPKLNAAETATRLATNARWSVAALGFLLAAGFCAVALSTRLTVPMNMTQLEKLLSADKAGGAVAPDFASLAEMERNWPRFRGAWGAGTSTETNLPLKWDGKTGQGIVWKSEIAAAGFNSPIVWGDRVFVSGADAVKRSILCYGTAQGELLWERAVEKAAGSQAQSPEVPEQTGYAASTMATDGRRVYVIFANGDLAAFTLDGRPVWAKNLGVPKNPHGHASSLTTWEGRLLVQLDQGEAEQNRSRLFAFDGGTGRVVWERTRAIPASWATPIVIRAAGQPQIITLGVPWVIAYAAGNGAELWRAEGLNNEVTPSPVFAGGLVLAVSPNEKLMAIRPDGQGDVSKTHVAWAAEDNIPDISSPVSDGALTFTLSTPGMLTCYDMKDGKKVWEQDLGMECNASPTLAGGRLFIISIKGQVLVAEVAREFKEIARSDLGENVYASPAIAGGKVFVRGARHLFCVGGEVRQARTE